MQKHINSHTEFANSYFDFKMGLCQVYQITFNLFSHNFCAVEDMIGVEPMIISLKSKSVSF